MSRDHGIERPFYIFDLFLFVLSVFCSDEGKKEGEEKKGQRGRKLPQMSSLDIY